MTPPVFAHGHLRLYLLSLLEEAGRGMHGYELIQALGDRFGGTYVPSAGTIYPRLAKLEEEGLVSKEADGRKTLYEITDAGRVELDARRDELDGIEEGVTDSVRRLADDVRASVDDAMRTLRAELAAAAREVRAEATDTARTVRDQGRTVHEGSRRNLHEAELLIAQFRSAMRTELRGSVAAGDLGADTVAALRRGLDRVRDEVTATLR